MPRYTKKKWNKKYVRDSHNCYSYMLDKINKNYVNICKKHQKSKDNNDCKFLKAQPGLFSGKKDVKFRRKYTCKLMNKRVLADNKHIFKTKKDCPKNYYKGSLFIHPNSTYHFYRQDDNGRWSHKDGTNNISNRDAKRRIIKDPLKAARKYHATKYEAGVYYSRHCTDYCIPKSKKKKFFSAYTRKKKRIKRKNKTRRRN